VELLLRRDLFPIDRTLPADDRRLVEEDRLLRVERLPRLEALFRDFVPVLLVRLRVALDRVAPERRPEDDIPLLCLRLFDFRFAPLRLRVDEARPRVPSDLPRADDEGLAAARPSSRSAPFREPRLRLRC